ncbi:hypothetical protein [Paenibacillus sp. FSL R5-0908]|uniref:hypothetical protein n=1 Tax=Paenibacillus sp. FSL R5-0908 TaxID=2921664 RepID=UPI0030F8B25B
MSSDQWPPDEQDRPTREQIIADIKAWESHYMYVIGLPVIRPDIAAIARAVQAADHDALVAIMRGMWEPPDALSLAELFAQPHDPRPPYRSWRPNEQGYLKSRFDRWRNQLGRSKRSYEQFRQAKRSHEPRRNGNSARLPGKPATRNCTPGKYRRPYPESEV